MGYINFLRPGNPALSVVVQPIKLGRDVIGGSLLFSPRALTLLTLLHYTGMCVMSNEKGEEEADQWARTRLPINNILRHLSSSDTTTGRFENHFVHGGGGGRHIPYFNVLRRMAIPGKYFHKVCKIIFTKNSIQYSRCRYSRILITDK